MAGDHCCEVLGAVGQWGIMNWLWLNVSVGAAFVLPVVGAPMWLVLRHPDTGPGIAFEAGPSQGRRPVVDLALPGPLRAEAQPQAKARLTLDDAWMRVLLGVAPA